MLAWFHLCRFMAPGVNTQKVLIINSRLSGFWLARKQPAHSMISPRQLGVLTYSNRNPLITTYLDCCPSSLLTFCLASCSMASDLTLTHMPSANTATPTACTHRLMEWSAIAPTHCKYPFAKVKLNADTTISKGTLVVVLRVSGQMMSRFRQCIVKSTRPTVGVSVPQSKKYSTHSRFGTQKRNQASRGSRWILEIDESIRPQLNGGFSISISQPAAEQNSTTPAQNTQNAEYPSNMPQQIQPGQQKSQNIGYHSYHILCGNVIQQGVPIRNKLSEPDDYYNGERLKIRTIKGSQQRQGMGI